MGLMRIIRFMYPNTCLISCDIGTVDGVEVITGWDESTTGPQPTQAQIDAARPEATMATTKVALENAVQRHLDDTAKVRGYDDILSACTYANSLNATFKIEGLAAVAWRDDVWSCCYGALAAVQSGTRAIPTEAELIAELPVMVW